MERSYDQGGIVGARRLPVKDEAKTDHGAKQAQDQLAVATREAAELLGISRAQLWKLHSAGKLPRPVRLGAKATRWRVDELRDWLKAGCPDRLTWQKMRGTAA